MYAQPRMLEPRHNNGCLASGAVALHPMPKLRSRDVASATYSPAMGISRARNSGIWATLALTTATATAQTWLSQSDC